MKGYSWKARSLRTLKVDEKVQADGLERLRRLKASRDRDRADRALDGLRHAAGEDANLVPAVLECVKARVTLGEISAALQERYGKYTPAELRA